MRSSVQSSVTRARRPWGHYAFLAAILTFLGSYLWDSWQAAATTSNLIFVLPVTLFCVVTAVMIGVRQYTDHLVGSAITAEGEADGKRNYTLPLCIGGFGTYVFLLPYIGFDVATFLFIAGSLVLLGERRPVFTLTYSLVFTLITVYGLKAMIPAPIETLLM